MSALTSEVSVPYDDPVLEKIAQDMEASLGPYFVGLVLNLVLMGVLTMQCLDYYRMFPKDRLRNKCLVGFLLLAGLFQSACFFEMAYSTFVAGYGDIAHWNKSHWTWWFEPISTSIIALVCQAFFLHRCYRVTKSWVVLAVAIFGMFVELGSGIACTVFAARFVYLTRLNLIHSRASASLWLASSTATDIWISAFLLRHLRKNLKSSFSSTDTIIRSLFRITMESASLTTVWVTTNLLIYAIAPTNMAWSPFQFNMGKIYSHTVLFTLASRLDLRMMLTSRVITSSSKGRQGLSDFPVSATRTKIQITTQVQQDVEALPGGLHAIAVAPFNFTDARTTVTSGNGGGKDKDKDGGSKWITSPFYQADSDENEDEDDGDSVVHTAHAVQARRHV